MVAAGARPLLPLGRERAVHGHGVALDGVLVDVLLEQLVDVRVLLAHAHELPVVGEHADAPSRPLAGCVRDARRGPALRQGRRVHQANARLLRPLDRREVVDRLLLHVVVVAEHPAEHDEASTTRTSTISDPTPPATDRW